MNTRKRAKKKTVKRTIYRSGYRGPEMTDELRAQLAFPPGVKAGGAIVIGPFEEVGKWANNAIWTLRQASDLVQLVMCARGIRSRDDAMDEVEDEELDADTGRGLLNKFEFRNCVEVGNILAIDARNTKYFQVLPERWCEILLDGPDDYEPDDAYLFMQGLVELKVLPPAIYVITD